MYVYYVCLLLLSEFNKCWREWSHTDNEIDENQKKNNWSHQKIQLLRLSVVVRGMGEWGKTSYANIKNVLHSFSLVKTDNQFQCVRQKASLSFSFIRTKKKKKNCESTTRNRTYNKCTPTETTEVEMRKFEEKSKRLLYSNWSKSLAPSLWSAWSWKHNSQIVFSQKTMCRENVGAVRHNNMKW